MVSRDLSFEIIIFFVSIYIYIYIYIFFFFFFFFFFFNHFVGIKDHCAICHYCYITIISI